MTLIPASLSQPIVITPLERIQSKINENIIFINTLKLTYPDNSDYYSSIERKFTEIKKDAEVELMLANTDEDCKFVIDNTITTIQNFCKKKCVLRYKKLSETLDYLRRRINSITKEFQGVICFPETRLLEKNYDKAVDILKKLKLTFTHLSKQKDNSETFTHEADTILKAIDSQISRLMGWGHTHKELRESLSHLRERINFTDNEFGGKPSFLDTSPLENDYNRAARIFEKFESILNTLSNQEEKNEALTLTKIEFDKVVESIDIGIAALSIHNTCDKMNKRIKDISDKFEELNFCEEQQAMKQVVDEADTRLSKISANTEKRNVINETLKELQKIDMKIEKANAVREIQLAYEHLVATSMELESEGLRLSKEVANASNSVSDKEDIINNIQLVGAPNGVDSLLRLDITRKCTLTSLARTLKDIYAKYGEHCIKTTIDLLPFSNRLESLDGIGTEELSELNSTCKKLLAEAKDELTWGEGGTPAKYPPLIAKDKMEEIINKHLKHTFRTIYLVYAEQCIMKSFKFYMQIKQFDGCNDENRSNLNLKADTLIKNMSNELEILFEKTQIKNIDKTFARNIENIISEYTIKVHELDKN